VRPPLFTVSRLQPDNYGEQEIIGRICRKAGIKRNSRLILGIGDDCAIFREPGSTEDLLFTTDMVIESVHFLAGVHPAASVGHRTLARGLSDIAAMGGRPLFCLLSLALAPWTNQAWLDEFLKGFFRLARQTGTTLAGGDLAKADRVMADIVVCGAVPRGKALRRDGARPGDDIYVSGELGGAALGLYQRHGRAWRKHLNPTPRLDLGRFLRQRLRATSAMDISDGLSLDLHRLCSASAVGAVIEQQPPAFPGARLEQVLHGGEDYELLFTVPAGQRVPCVYRGVKLARIGTIVRGRPGTVFFKGTPLEPLGYDHFAKFKHCLPGIASQ